MALKPCPDCGATTIEEYGPMLKRVRPFEKHRYYYMIQCQKCHKETKLFKTEEEAVEEWNKTAEDEKIKLKSCPFCGSKEGTAGETMPGKRIDLRPKSVKEETRAMEAAGRMKLIAGSMTRPESQRRRD